MTKISKRIYESISASQYAAWITNNKPANFNQRAMKRIKNKAFKKFCKMNGLVGRIKTHNHASPSFILWKKFNESFFALQQELLKKKYGSA